MGTITCSNCSQQGHRYINCLEALKPALAARKNKHKGRTISCSKGCINSCRKGRTISCSKGRTNTCSKGRIKGCTKGCTISYNKGCTISYSKDCKQNYELHWKFLWECKVFIFSSKAYLSIKWGWFFN